MRALWTDLRYLIENYNGGRPLADFLKAYFKLHHRLGSRDRRLLAEAAFCWFRAAQGFDAGLSFEEKAQACMALCGTAPKLAGFLPPDWSTVLELDAAERQAFLETAGFPFRIEGLFGDSTILSTGISRDEWLPALLQQPHLFARLRTAPAPLFRVLQQHGVSYQARGTCIELPTGTPLHTLWPPAAYTIQDASSQATGALFKPHAGERWWDCCAGGGGKSLLLTDMEPEIKLTVSDVRANALKALAERFVASGLKPPRSLVLDTADGTATAAAFPRGAFDAVLCDVPCSGSGTWGRTPEARHFFDLRTLETLPSKQAAITRNAASRLRAGGRVIYITCSVFRQENEAVVEAVLAADDSLSIEESRLINGTAAGADSLFVAVLRKAH